MQYIVFVENNFKENEPFIFYLQYTGNERKLQKFAEIVDRAYYRDMEGDYSEFSINISSPVSEQSVLEHLRINLGTYNRMFNICKGNFMFDFDAFENLTDTQVATALDEMFYHCRVKDYFK